MEPSEGAPRIKKTRLRLCKFLAKLGKRLGIKWYLSRDCRRRRSKLAAAPLLAAAHLPPPLRSMTCDCHSPSARCRTLAVAPLLADVRLPPPPCSLPHPRRRSSACCRALAVASNPQHLTTASLLAAARQKPFPLRQLCLSQHAGSSLAAAHLQFSFPAAATLLSSSRPYLNRLNLARSRTIA